MAKRKNVLPNNNVLACFTVKHLPFGQALRSSTATSTETSPQNVALVYRKSFAILSSRSCCFMWPKCSKNKLARSGFRIQMEKKSLHLYAQVVVKISNLVISRHCYAKYRKN